MSTDRRVPHAALELLLACGYDATSVDELAEAAGISRSTFFRRYGSKEEMVFADHEERLAAARAALARNSARGADAVVPAAMTVFDAHAADPELARLRRTLLHKVPALRDRELVSTHSFERLFRNYLLGLDRGGTISGTAAVRQETAQDATQAPSAEPLPLPDGRRITAVALASAVVAVHNDFLRAWLRSPGPEIRPALEAALSTQVRHHANAAAAPAAAPTVVVVTPGTADPSAVAAEVERALRRGA